MKKYLVVNADDLGASKGINQAIVDCHVNGIVTSASLMVTGRAATEAVAMCRDHPQISIGLHFDVWGEDERQFDLTNLGAVRDELHRQLSAFHTLVGRLPTHIDSHRHAHREPGVFPVFQDVVKQLGVPLRHDGRVRYVGGFYAQWEWQITELDYVLPPHLIRLLHEVNLGWTELACHPGYITPDFQSIYLSEREVEVQSLTDPIIRNEITACQIQLASFGDWAKQ